VQVFFFFFFFFLDAGFNEALFVGVFFLSLVIFFGAFFLVFFYVFIGAFLMGANKGRKY
jgi:hypothetical protein